MPGGSEVEALKALASHGQSWADWSTLVVFIGLLGEIGITFAYTKDNPRSEIILGIICGVVIAVGVLGELKFGSRAAQANAQLRIISEGQLSDAEGRLGKAEDGLRTAIGEAGDAKASADSAANAAERAKKQAKEVEAQAAELRKQNLELAQKLASLEKAAFTRGLQQEEFAAKLKPFKGFPVSIETVSDFEARRTAMIIEGGLHMAEWQVSSVVVRIDSASVIDFFFPGVMIEMNCMPDFALPPEEIMKSIEVQSACFTASESLVKALGKNGIEAQGPRPDISMPHNTIRVRVALKPMPGQPGENLLVTH